MKVKGLLNKDSIYYYCIACNDWFEIDESEDKVCEHYENWGIEEVEDDEFESFRCVVKLNYEVEIKPKTEEV
jgi:hypothetical protein